MNTLLNIGLDIGSTTVKLVVLNENKEIVYKIYKRHLSDIKSTLIDILNDAKDVIKDREITISMTGSGAMDISDSLNIPFIQEVIACTNSVKEYIPQTDVAIELGGEDGKITYFGSTIDQKMNGACAGGTGSYIDQMASLLKTDGEGIGNLAKSYKTIHPIASRCGVFAKTDVQALLNEGISKEDIAASILQGVVNQTITALAQGKPIKGKVAFLGGPLYFIEELRNRFVETLNLKENEVIVPENPQYFVAIGAALGSINNKSFNSHIFYEKINNLYFKIEKNNVSQEPLFLSENEYIEFKQRHDLNKVKKVDINSYEGNSYLGIDAGSTTTKLALISEKGELIYSYYSNNNGNPLESVVNGLKDMYININKNIKIVNSCVTGYGEGLIKNALGIDFGEVETVAHYKAAKFFLPDVDCILDIGGQDMKCLKIDNGVINSIMLNEACSSGCGSFIETFANSLNIDLPDFVSLAVKSKSPVNLGTRCTVFMNSSVKQAQKQGFDTGDIAAGICLSVIKNALYKVIRLKDSSSLGQKIVVQGGTFYNDAVLRALELELNNEVIKPDISGIMGAFGCAIIAKEKSKNNITTLLNEHNIYNFKYSNTNKRCGSCTNNCLLTISKFENGKKFISGNRCEKPTKIDNKLELPNLYKYKLDRLFSYRPLSDDEATRGIIGIPRVLNIYDDYPFWHTLFTNLKYKVLLSSPSSKEIYEMGLHTIPSESICYPAKLSHGHVIDLINKGVNKIFYPSVYYNIKENKCKNHVYNCPIVISNSENINLNIDKIYDKNIKFYNPYLSLEHKNKLPYKMLEVLKDENISLKEMKIAIDKAYEELYRYKFDINNEGKKTIAYLKDKNIRGIVLAGKPYHLDPEINHGIPNLINSLGFAVLTEDSVAHLSEDIDVPNQWIYHSRIYNAANAVCEKENLDIIQLTSFGCTTDAVSTDVVEKILKSKNKISSIIKIDQINNLGAAKIRIRSLASAIKERENIKEKYKPVNKSYNVINNADIRDYTLLIPQISDIHLTFMESAFENSGYKAKLLKNTDEDTIKEGLKYANNDLCYPFIIIIGQVMKAIKSNNYDLSKIAILMVKTNGPCIASNMTDILRDIFKEQGLEHIPVIPLSIEKDNYSPKLKISPNLLYKIGQSIVYGDLLTKVLLRTRPYEKEKDSANKLYEKWIYKCRESLKNNNRGEYKKNIYNIVNDFEKLPIYENITKPKVGLTGDIYIKFNDFSNNNIIDLLEQEGAEVIAPDLMSFLLYCGYGGKLEHENICPNSKILFTSNIAIRALEFLRKDMQNALNNSKRFSMSPKGHDLAKCAQKYISLGNQVGDGWIVTGEIVDYVKNDVTNILSMQPFGCLPGHVVSKGIIKKLKEDYKNVNIASIDYDPSETKVNQLNRIRLMMSVAHKNLG